MEKQPILELANELFELMGKENEKPMDKVLKPCPFCNSTDYLMILYCKEECCDDTICENCDKKRYTICCSARENGCGAICGYAETEKKAIEKWNRRATNG